MQRFMSLDGVDVGARVREVGIEIPDGLVPGVDIFTEAFAATLVPLVPGAAVGFVVQGDGTFAAPPEPAPSVAELLAYAAGRRYAVETGGLALNGAVIATDETSQAKIGNAYQLLQATGAARVEFKAQNGFVTLSAEQFKGLAIAVGLHVQACFAVEAEVEAAILASPPTVTTRAQVEASFAPLALSAPA